MADPEAKLKTLAEDLKRQKERHKREQQRKLLEIRATQAKAKEQERKRKSRTLIVAGELCEKAGIAEVDRPTLLGGLLDLAKKLEDPLIAKKFQTIGQDALKTEAKENKK